MIGQILRKNEKNQLIGIGKGESSSGNGSGKKKRIGKMKLSEIENASVGGVRTKNGVGEKTSVGATQKNVGVWRHHLRFGSGKIQDGIGIEFVVGNPKEIEKGVGGETRIEKNQMFSKEAYQKVKSYLMLKMI